MPRTGRPRVETRNNTHYESRNASQYIGKYMAAADATADRNGELWTPEEDQMLADLVAAGSTLTEAAIRLRRTYKSVASRALLIGARQNTPKPGPIESGRYCPHCYLQLPLAGECGCEA